MDARINSQYYLDVGRTVEFIDVGDYAAKDGNFRK